MSTPNPNQDGNAGGNPGRGLSRPINIQPEQVGQLVQALRNEIAMAKAAGPDTPKGKQHSTKADNIKQLLLTYQAQQQAKMRQNGGAQAGGQTGSLAMNQQPGGQNMGMSNQRVNNMPNTRNSGMAGGNAFQQGADNRQMGTPGLSQQVASPNPMNRMNNVRQTSGTPSLPDSSITVENFNQLRAKMAEFERKIQQLEASKKNYTLPDQISQIESQITELKSKYSKYQKVALLMKSKLVEQVKLGQLAQPQSAGSQAAPPVSTPQNFNPSLLAQIPTNPQQNATKAVSQAQQAQPATQTRQPSQPPVDKTGKSTSPVPQGSNSLQGSNAASPARINSNLNLQNIIKQAAPSMPISSSINVRPPAPVTMKPNNVSRPTLSGGVANGIGSSIGTPAIVKLPSYELNQSGNAQIPDNGGRVLTKRKLNELIQTIGADQGDGKTVIDGDVEELLLDLADEFINSVTGFACRLAKHRKVESIDVRDIQLHLEKNWNIRIPGYAMDEIKSTRKWQPTPSYQQKVSGVDISKSVNDING